LFSDRAANYTLLTLFMADYAINNPHITVSGQKVNKMARILIAEDDSSMRQFLSIALKRAGHEVDAVADGEDALTAINNRAYDLLLADIIMPGMDGIALAKRASSIVPGMKVMFITGFAAVAMGQKKMEESDAKVLSKPFHLRDLVDQVEKMLVSAATA